MPYKLYLHPRSGGAMVEAALAEIGAAYETQFVDLRQGAQQEPAYLAVNPHGKVPTLVTQEGETLTETLAILLSLDDRHPESSLLPPRATPEREHALRWLAFAATELYTNCRNSRLPGTVHADAGECRYDQSRCRQDLAQPPAPHGGAIGGRPVSVGRALLPDRCLLGSR
jgi:GST-like protein